MDGKAGSRGFASLSVGGAPRVTSLLQRRDPETSKVHQHHSKSIQGGSFGLSHRIQESQTPASQIWVSPQHTDKSRLGFPEQSDPRLQKAWEQESLEALLSLPTCGTLNGDFPSTLLKPSLSLFLLEEMQLPQGSSVKRGGGKRKKILKRDVVAHTIVVKS